MAKKAGFKTGGDMMDIVARENRKPAPKNGAFGLGTWESALGVSKKAPKRR
jgi:hypothetical protein